MILPKSGSEKQATIARALPVSLNPRGTDRNRSVRYVGT
jgi:hypothetical protein